MQQKAKVITYSVPQGAKVILTLTQIERLRAEGIWPRTGNGTEFCNVTHGEHWGTPSYTDAEIETIIADAGDVTRATDAQYA